MATDRRKTIHIHSAISDKQPTPSSLEIGELAVNNHADNEFISTKNSNNEVVRFSADKTLVEWMEKKTVIPYDGEVVKSDTDENKSSITIKLNQKVASATVKNGEVNDAKNINGDLINASTDSGLSNGAGFSIDTTAFALVGASPSFKSITTTSGAQLNGAIVGASASTAAYVYGRNTTIIGASPNGDVSESVVYKRTPSVTSEITATTMDGAIEEAYDKSAISVSATSTSAAYTYSIMQGGTQVGSILVPKDTSSSQLTIADFDIYSAKTDAALATLQSDLDSLETRTDAAETTLEESINDLQTNKADQSVVDEMGNMISSFNAVINNKLDKSTFETYTANTSSSANKLDTTAFTAYSASVATTLNEKVGLSELNSAVSSMNSKINKKVDSSTFTAYQTSVDTALSTKLDATAFTDISDSIQGKLDTTAFTAYSSTTNSKIDGKVDTSAYDSYTALTEFKVSTKLDASIFEEYTANTQSGSNKLDVSAFTAYSSSTKTALDKTFNAAKYDSSSKTIIFSNGDTQLASIDATPFVVDGMVESVAINSGNLVITWNTDSGKETISIPLTEIFDPSNYYTKAETNAIITTMSGNVASSAATLNTKINTVSGNVNALSVNVISIEETLTTAVDSLKIEKADNVAFIQLGNNVEDLTARLNELSSGTTSGSVSTTTFAAYSAATDADIDAISGDVNSLSTNIVSISANTSIVSGAVTSLDNKVNAVSAQISSVSGSVETLKTNTATTNSKVNTVSANVASLSANVQTKLDTTAFTAYAASAATELSKKLDASAFTAYSSSTDAKLNAVSADVTSLSGQMVSAITEFTSSEYTLATAVDELGSSKADYASFMALAEELRLLKEEVKTLSDKVSALTESSSSATN